MTNTSPELAYLEPWDRQPEERSKEWKAFQIYRDLGYGRTYKKVAAKMDLSPATIYSYANKHDWADRVHAHDVYEDRVFQAEKAQALKDMAFKQAKLTADTIEAVMQPINAMLTKAEDPEFKEQLMQVDFDDLIKQVQASARVLDKLFGAERTALGAPSEITQVQGAVKHEVNHKLDDDQLGDLLELANKYILNAPSGEGEAEDIIDAEIIEVQRHDPSP